MNNRQPRNPGSHEILLKTTDPSLGRNGFRPAVFKEIGLNNERPEGNVVTRCLPAVAVATATQMEKRSMHAASDTPFDNDSRRTDVITPLANSLMWRALGQFVPRASADALLKLISQLLTDETTRLPNYKAFEMLYEGRRTSENSVLLLLDIKGFGKINERRGGHLRGNEVLRQVAEWLKELARREDDLIARWSLGDEFIINSLLRDPRQLDGMIRRFQQKTSVKSGRRYIELEFWVTGTLTEQKRIDEIEPFLHETLRRLKAREKAKINGDQPKWNDRRSRR